MINALDLRNVNLAEKASNYQHNKNIFKEVLKETAKNPDFLYSKEAQEAAASVGIDYSKLLTNSGSIAYGYRGKVNDSISSTPAAVSIPNEPIPSQFLQTKLAGYVAAQNTKQDILKALPIVQTGSFAYNQVICQYLQVTGNAEEYTDFGKPSFVKANFNYQARNVVRFKTSYQVGYLENLRSQVDGVGINYNSLLPKAAQIVLDRAVGSTAFYGNAGSIGSGITAGFINDPNNLPTVSALPTGAGGSTRARSKSTPALFNDIKDLINNLTYKSGNLANPVNVKVKIYYPNQIWGYLNTPTDPGFWSVVEQVRKIWPLIEWVPMSELSYIDSNPNENPLDPYYTLTAIADTVVDDALSTDGGLIEAIINTASSFVIGVDQLSQPITYLAAATAGNITFRSLWRSDMDKL